MSSETVDPEIEAILKSLEDSKDAKPTTPPPASPAPTPQAPVNEPQPTKRRAPRKTEDDAPTEPTTKTRSKSSASELLDFIENSPEAKAVFNKIVQEQVRQQIQSVSSDVKGIQDRLSELSKGNFPPETLDQINKFAANKPNLAALLSFGPFWEWVERIASERPAALSTYIVVLKRMLTDDAAALCPNLVNICQYKIGVSGKHTEINVPARVVELHSWYLKDNYQEPLQDAQTFIDMAGILAKAINTPNLEEGKQQK